MESNQRSCPECKSLLTYSNKYERNRAEKKNKICVSCSTSGEKNPFYGRKHKQDSKDKIAKFRTGKDLYGEENKQKLKVKMTQNNPMAGKSVYDVWIEKYGKEEADIKMISYKEKHSLNNSGEKNKMYGKPSPKGSGNGWSGWYKDWFFRSLRELSYMIKEIEQKNKKWESGELKKYKIQYKDNNGNCRNYFPDFVIDSSVVVECKPVRLQGSKEVLLKTEAAEKFCKENNMTFLIVEPEMLTEEEIKELYNTNKIKFLPKYEIKFLNKYKYDK